MLGFEAAKRTALVGAARYNWGSEVASSEEPAVKGHWRLTPPAVSPAPAPNQWRREASVARQRVGPTGRTGCCAAPRHAGHSNRQRRAPPAGRARTLRQTAGAEPARAGPRNAWTRRTRTVLRIRPAAEVPGNSRGHAAAGIPAGRWSAESRRPPFAQEGALAVAKRRTGAQCE